MMINKIKISLITLFTLYIFWPTFKWMNLRFSEPESFYAHGYLVPFVSAYLLWRKKEQILKIDKAKEGKWIILLIFALIVHILAFYFEINFISGLFFIAVICALIGYNCGYLYLRGVIFPVLFLFFMVPMPKAMTLGISFYLKIITARIAGFLISFIVPLESSGSLIYLPNGVLTVGAPCSGLKSLIALAALSLLFAYLTGFNFKKQVLFFLSALPIAFFANIFRIMLLILVFYVYGSEIAMGWFHDFSGMLLFIVAFVGLVILRKVFILCGNKSIV